VISFIPLLAVSLSVFSAYGGFESLVSKIEPFIIHNLVEASGVEASRYIRRVVRRIHSGALGLSGVIGLLFTSTKLFHDMETAVQRVWQVRSHRLFLKRIVVYWLVMFIGPLILAAALGAIGSRDLGLLKIVPKDAIAAVFTFIALLSIYKLVPAVKVSWRSSLISAITTTGAILLAQAFYAVIIKRVFMLGKMYGSFASVPIFLIWILVLWWICLAGVALTATLEKGRTDVANGSGRERVDKTREDDSANFSDRTEDKLA
jgi:membrane protein